MATAPPAAAAIQLPVSDADGAVRRDVGWHEDQRASASDNLALSDLRVEAVNSMSTSTRQNNKARHLLQPVKYIKQTNKTPHVTGTNRCQVLFNGSKHSTITFRLF